MTACTALIEHIRFETNQTHYIVKLEPTTKTIQIMMKIIIQTEIRINNIKK